MGSHEEENSEWTDVTACLREAEAVMHVGEMVHGDSFSLYSAVSAVELMEPKMDVGCGTIKNVDDVVLPDMLSDTDTLHVMDSLIACLATWLDAHTLPQTVFSCAYVQRPDRIPRLDLGCFIQLTIATMALVHDVLSVEQVAREEDFVFYRFGFSLVPLSGREAAMLVDSYMREDSQSAERVKETTKRVLFMHSMHALLTILSGPRRCDPSRTEQASDCTRRFLRDIKSTTPRGESETIGILFDPTFNRHVLANTPPRRVPLLSRACAFSYFERLLDELDALVRLPEYIWPPMRKSSGNVVDLQPCNLSYHTLLFGLTQFSAEWNPSIVTRSFLKRRLLCTGSPSTPIFGISDATVVSLLLSDTGSHAKVVSAKLSLSFEAITPALVHFVGSLCQNRGRQRRTLLRSLAVFDDAVSHYLRKRQFAMDSTSVLDDEKRLRNVSTNGGDKKPYLQSKTSDSSSAVVDTCEVPELDASDGERTTRLSSEVKRVMEVFAEELLVQMMVHHWLLGFECNLYQPAEYAPIYFYVSYALAKGLRATTALVGHADRDRERSLPPCRYALCLMDEGRAGLSRGLFSLLHALSLGVEWTYSWRRTDAIHWNADSDTAELNSSEADDCTMGTIQFDPEVLWHEQRFGAMSLLRNGPQYMNHKAFLGLVQAQSVLLSKSKHALPNEVLRRLEEARDGFQYARDALHKALSVAKVHKWMPLLEEATALGRVAIANSITVSALSSSYDTSKPRATSTSQSCGLAERGPPSFDVCFSFEKHRHFAVVTTQPLSKV